MFRLNGALRHAERRLVFDAEGLRRLAAQSVGRSPADVVNFSKLAGGGFNRTFLITLHDDFQMVARIPYPAMVPKYYAVASEVATMEFLRSSGLPVPQVYGHSPASDNAAKTEYILMEFMRGTKLSDVWLELGESDIVSILRQLAQLESQFLSPLAEASTTPTTWRRWPGEQPSRSRTSVSALVQIRDCLCGMAGDHSST